jgi:DNA-directed RNA polymerase specialized sigma24 family protein
MAGKHDALGGSPLPSHPGAPGPEATVASVDELVADLYQAHGLALVRMAKLLLRDQPTAEDVVQDAFLGLYRATGSTT